MTDVIVLAAGLGRRLAGVSALPKWLTPVNGSCPAQAHLEAFERAGVDRVHVVVSPDAASIEEFVEPWRRRLALHLVPNDHAADRNNWYSLLLGLDAVTTTGAADVVVVNSDLFARASWFSALLEHIHLGGHPAALAVDPARGRTAEAMKVAVDTEGASVTAIGKVGVSEPAGEYVGLAWWSASAAAALRPVLGGFVGDAARIDNWYEHAIQCHLDDGGRYAAVAVPSSEWVEIDDEADLDAARRLCTPEGSRS